MLTLLRNLLGYIPSRSRAKQSGRKVKDLRLVMTGTHKLFWSHVNSDQSTVKFSTPIIGEKIVDGRKAFRISISARVASLPFPPFGGKRTAWVWADKCGQPQPR